MADLKRQFRDIPFAGGVISDEAATELVAYDMENLLPPAGNAKRLRPRDGVDYLLTLETDETEGYVIHEVKLDDSARTHLITVSSAATGRVELISEHTDMEGLQSVEPRGGGSLPDTDPAISPLVAKLEISGESVLATVMFHDGATDQVVGPATLVLGFYFTEYAYVFRTENYIVVADLHGGTTFAMNAYKLSTLDLDGSNMPDYQVDVYTDTPDVTPFKPVWAYKGDIVFIADDVGVGAHTDTGPDDDSEGAHDYKLYKVDLANETVTSNSITGLPTDVYGFLNRQCDCDGVSTDGYLWTAMYGAGDKKTLVKIDPSTGAVAASGYASGEDQAGYNEFLGMAPGADGIMYYDNGANATYSTSSDAQTQTLCTSATTGDGLYFSSDTSTIRNCVLNGKSIMFLNAGGVALANVNAGTKIGTAFDPHDGQLPCWINRDGTQLWFVEWLYSDSTNWTIHCVNTSDGTSTTRTFTADLGTSDPIIIADAFAYGLKNLQGNRL